MLTVIFARVSRSLSRYVALLALASSLNACAMLPGETETTEAPVLESPPQTVIEEIPPPPAAPPVPEPPEFVSFDEAVQKAADALFAAARLPSLAGRPAAKHTLVIDPFIDGLSAIQSKVTRAAEAKIADIVRVTYTDFLLQPFLAAHVRETPLVVIGTLTPVSSDGEPAPRRAGYRFCLALIDLQSGLISSTAAAYARLDGVDHSPTAYFRDSPAWMKEPSIDAYVQTCESGKIGEPVKRAYRESVLVSTLISEAILAYDQGRYREALQLYADAAQLPGGDQLRVYNGLYITNLKLGRKQAAKEAFAKIVEYGFAHKRLALQFLFKPGTSAFWPDRRISVVYGSWLKEIARQFPKEKACLEITGHATPTGSEALNERLSQSRAEYVKRRLELEAPALNGRAIASGAGARENLIGTGRDDASDALDRRVTFQIHPC
ncbi:MAG TPA: OmpA family protein [Candidatus Eisenbacteria bacterium]|nr:OmpA family protein [Candidatus Eisenbacteria bacterium]